jgi:hypothetical protein
VPALLALVLFGALILLILAPFAVETHAGSFAVVMRGHSAHVVSTRGTRGHGAPFLLDGTPQGSTRSLTLRMTPPAADTIATPGAAVTCQAPPPATPSPTPAGDTSSLLGPTPTPAPDPDAIVDPRLDAMAATAATALEACWNARDWNAVASILTPRFLQSSLGIDTPRKAEPVEALTALELGPLHIETIGPVGIWSDGRGAVDVLYLRGRGNPVQAVAARWFLIAERGVVRFDEEVLLLPPPLGDRVTVGFAIADDQQPMQWSSPTSGEIPVSPVTALHGANRGRESHSFLLEGTGGETVGALTLPPWRQGDLVLLDLPAGTYRLHDPAVPGSELVLRVTEGDG